MPVRRRVTTRGKVFQLPLYIGEQAARADAEEVGAHPVGAKLFFHQDEPIESLLGRAYAARRLEAHLVTCPVEVFADGTYHDCADGQSCIGRLFAC